MGRAAVHSGGDMMYERAMLLPLLDAVVAPETAAVDAPAGLASPHAIRLLDCLGQVLPARGVLLACRCCHDVLPAVPIEIARLLACMCAHTPGRLTV